MDFKNIPLGLMAFILNFVGLFLISFLLTGCGNDTNVVGGQSSLSITKTGTGSGTVMSSPTGISCGTDCSESYASGTGVTLTAIADTGSTFSGWSGDCSGTGTCVLVINTNKAATAIFSTKPVEPPVVGDPFLPTVATINSLAKGVTFDSLNNLYISTVSGKVMKLDGISLSTFIAEGSGGLDFNRHIRFSQGNFYVQNVLNVGSTTLPHIDEVLLFNSAGTFVRRLLDENAINASFFEDIAVNAQGQLYVAPGTSSTSIVVRVDPSGQNLTNIVQNGAGGVFVPTSMAVDSNGNLYVGTPSVVSKFSGDGTFITKIAQDGINGFSFASNLSVDRNNNLYIGNVILGASPTPSTWNVLRFDSQGTFLGQFIPAGTAGLSAFPDDIGLDSQGRLYIADSLGVDGVARFTQSGAFDRIEVKNFGLSKPLEKLQKQEEKEHHYQELELKDKTLAKEVAQQ